MGDYSWRYTAGSCALSLHVLSATATSNLPPPSTASPVRDGACLSDHGGLARVRCYRVWWERSQGSGAGTRTPYRWLVPTSGRQPTVAEENAHPGTTAWRLPGPAADVGGHFYGSVTGYVAEQAVRPGRPSGST